MTDTDGPEHRAYHQPDPSQVTLRDDDDSDGVFSVRMPIASTGAVRNEGDEPLARDELAGMAEQVDQQSVGVFLDHGASALGGGGGMFGNRYSAIGKVGTWEDPELVDQHDDDGPALLEASARLMDPETLPAASGGVREALTALKSQVERDIPLSSSIGWRDDEDAPGGNDLMEASIVGIPADPLTVGGDTAAMARAAVDAGADPEAFLAALRAVVMEPDDDGREANDTVTDESTASDEQSEDTTDDGQDEQRDAPEWAQELLEAQQKQTSLLEDIHESTRPDDEDDDSDDEEDDDDDDDEDEEDQSADEPDDEQSGDGESDAEREVSDLREHLDALRAGGVDVSDVDLPDADDTDDETDEAQEASAYDKFGLK